MAFTPNERRAAASAYNLPITSCRFRFYANEFVTSPTIWTRERFHWLLGHHDRQRSLGGIASYIGGEPFETVI